MVKSAPFVPCCPTQREPFCREEACSKAQTREETSMSRYMEIEIRVKPFYETSFAHQFPNISELLRRMDYQEPLKKESSLYTLVDTVVSIARSPRTPSAVKDRIGPIIENMRALKREAREHLLARRLKELDQWLYLLEDRFDELEQAL